MGYIRHVLVELWRPITFEPITYLIISIHHTVRLIDLSKNNYAARLANHWFTSYGPPKSYKDMLDISHIYFKSLFTIIDFSDLLHIVSAFF